ncbi:hypothetical protein HGRIS_011242 [Hohenbuehelia grisea]|uniref:Plethodontid modulating factor n=1 Tax=Hohenbuehelia grisea TaxID=104357 RepID=A0ABR3JVA7_9AGAR
MPLYLNLFHSVLVAIVVTGALLVAADDPISYTHLSCTTGETEGALYSDPAGKCHCGPKDGVPAEYNKCEPPAGNEYALAVCTQVSDGTSSKCSKGCTTKYALDAIQRDT